ncbi:inositol monophosphatase family protein [Marinobacteraceae bacterium S3BR75-40.1]
MQPAIKMALRTARQSSEFLRTQFERLEPVTTNAETALKQMQAIEKGLYDNCLEQLQRAYRQHYFAPMGDLEAGSHTQSWHIFPLMGATNYLRGLPEFGLALVQKQNNRVENAVLVCPVLDEEYCVSRGYGATMNGRRIRASGSQHLSQAIVASNLISRLPANRDALAYGETMAALGQAAGGIRGTDFTLLEMARVASGRMDGAVLRIEDAVDAAVGGLLANECGGLASDFSGNPLTAASSECVMANNRLFKELLKTIHPFASRLRQG